MAAGFIPVLCFNKPVLSSLLQALVMTAYHVIHAMQVASGWSLGD